MLADIDIKDIDIDIKSAVKRIAWFIIVKSLFTALTTLIGTINTLIDDLTSLFLLYRLIGETRTLIPSKTLIKDTFTFIAEAISRYDSSCFYGVIIDIGISKYLIASFG